MRSNTAARVVAALYATMRIPIFFSPTLFSALFNALTPYLTVSTTSAILFWQISILPRMATPQKHLP